jgi:peptidylprolyl isomerase
MINKTDFIELEYTGKISDDKRVFDTTDKDLAIKEGIHNPNGKYGPVVICLGQSLLVPGLEKDILDDKELNKSYSVDIEPELAFGKKDSSKLRLVPLKVFKERNINPYPGLQVQIDNSIATIKTVTGGRCIVDFNNPLSGHNITYEYKIISIVTDPKTKVESIFDLLFGVKVNAKEADGKVLVELPENVPSQVIKAISDKVKEIAKIELIIEKIKK